jgi:hypothetical protein
MVFHLLHTLRFHPLSLWTQATLDAAVAITLMSRNRVTTLRRRHLHSGPFLHSRLVTIFRQGLIRAYLMPSPLLGRSRRIRITFIPQLHATRTNNHLIFIRTYPTTLTPIMSIARLLKSTMGNPNGTDSTEGEASAHCTRASPCRLINFPV